MTELQIGRSGAVRSRADVEQCYIINYLRSHGPQGLPRWCDCVREPGSPWACKHPEACGRSGKSDMLLLLPLFNFWIYQGSLCVTCTIQSSLQVTKASGTLHRYIKSHNSPTLLVSRNFVLCTKSFCLLVYKIETSGTRGSRASWRSCYNNNGRLRQAQRAQGASPRRITATGEVWRCQSFQL